MEVQGVVKAIGKEQQISASFVKRELVITTDEQYPQVLMVEFTQDNTALLNDVKVGASLLISINIRGREWTNPKGEVKYFTSLQAWKIDKGAAAPQDFAKAPSANQAAPVQVQDGDGDLPF